MSKKSLDNGSQNIKAKTGQRETVNNLLNVLWDMNIRTVIR